MPSVGGFATGDGFSFYMRPGRRNLGDDRVDVGTAWNNLAGRLADTDRHEEAEACYRRAVDIYRSDLGTDHA